MTLAFMKEQVTKLKKSLNQKQRVANAIKEEIECLNIELL